jgi:hypothetical protein
VKLRSTAVAVVAIVIKTMGEDIFISTSIVVIGIPCFKGYWS